MALSRYLLSICTVASLLVSLVSCATGTSSTSSSTTSSSASVTASAQSISGWTYIGCYHDHDGTIRGSERVIGNATVSYSNMDLSACSDYCGSGAAGSPYTYFGVEDGYECWCGQALNIAEGNGNYLASDSYCDMPCPETPSQLCGGAWYINMYSASSSSSTTSTSTSSQSPNANAPSGQPSSSSASASTSASPSAGSSKVSGGTIAAAVIAGILGLAVCIIGGMWLLHRRHGQKDKTGEDKPPVPGYQPVSYGDPPNGPQHQYAQTDPPTHQIGGNPLYEMSHPQA